MISPNNMANEVIDLTVSPSPEYISIDTDAEGGLSSGEITTSPQYELGRTGVRKNPRRKKRKRPVIEEGNLTITTQARSTSLEEGKVEPSGAFRRGEPHLSNRNRNRNVTLEVELEQETSPAERRSNGSNIFFIDVKPAPLPTTSLFVASTAVSGQTIPSLLLPAHVSVFGTTPTEILPSSSTKIDGEDYIDYLEFDDRKGAMRYFETPINESVKKPRVLCKHCGAEGDHRTSECLVLICLTCGARNEHPTRSCPISKTCFSCGMKGHINATCPNRRMSFNSSGANKYDDCDRCGSLSHKTNECPTLWRLYEYLTDQERNRIVRVRAERKILSLGQGGEGYIASDEWCYNCGNCGHWGDDCQDVPHNNHLPSEQSAFGTYNLSSGPFYDPHSEPLHPTSSRREPRDWEQANSSPGIWHDDMPDNVGGQARHKNITRMKEAHEKAVDDDPDDWFGNPNNHKLSSRSSNKAANGSRILSFGKSLQKAARQFQSPPAKTSLLDRLGDSFHGGHSQDPPPRSSHNRYNSNSRRDDHVRDQDNRKYRSRGEPGPRYKGGYRV